MEANGRKTTARKVIVVVLSIVALLPVFGYYIVTPLWLDYFKQITINLYNVSQNTTAHKFIPLFPSTQICNSYQINIFFLLTGQWSFICILCGVALLSLLIICPDWLRRTTGTSHSNKHIIPIMIGGFSMALSSLLFNYSISGSRTSIPAGLTGQLWNSTAVYNKVGELIFSSMSLRSTGNPTDRYH